MVILKVHLEMSAVINLAQVEVAMPMVQQVAPLVGIIIIIIQGLVKYVMMLAINALALLILIVMGVLVLLSNITKYKVFQRIV